MSTQTCVCITFYTVHFFVLTKTIHLSSWSLKVSSVGHCEISSRKVLMFLISFGCTLCETGSHWSGSVLVCDNYNLASFVPLFVLTLCLCLLGVYALPVRCKYRSYQKFKKNKKQLGLCSVCSSDFAVTSAAAAASSYWRSSRSFWSNIIFSVNAGMKNCLCFSLSTSSCP